MTSLEDESCVEKNVEHEELESLRSKLEVKTKEMERLRVQNKKLAAQCSKSRSIERELSSNIEELSSTHSELQTKIKKLEKQLSRTSEMAIEEVMLDTNDNKDLNNNQKGLYNNYIMYVTCSHLTSKEIQSILCYDIYQIIIIVIFIN